MRRNQILLLMVLIFSLPFSAHAATSIDSEDSISASDSEGDSGKRIVGYFAQWGIYGRDYQVADIPADKLTHINYAFVGIDGATLTVKSVDEYADFQKVCPAENGLPAQTWTESEQYMAGSFGRLGQLKAQYPHLKVLISVGGWTLSTFFSDVALTDASRSKFAKSCVEMVAKYGFDGVDLDWEYPVQGGLPQCPDVPNESISFWTEKTCQKYRPQDKENYVLLLKELREQLDAQSTKDGKRYLLTIAGPAGPDKIVNFDFKAMEGYLDFVNLMGYDLAGGWDSTTGHQANLYLNPAGPSDLSVDGAVRDYEDAGLPDDKIVVGVPFYGRAWEGALADTNGLFSTFTGLPSGAGAGNWETGVFDYWKIVEMMDQGSLYGYWDRVAQASYAYGSNLASGKSGGMFITFDDTRAMGAKADYINAKGLGGAMFWELSGDIRDSDDPRSLINVLAAKLDMSNDPGNATVLPGIPELGYLDPDQADGDYTISWIRNSGPSGVRWELFENSVSIHSQDIAASDSQSGQYAVSGRADGTYAYYIRLYNSDGGYSQSASQSVTVSSSTGDDGGDTGGDTGGNSGVLPGTPHIAWISANQADGDYKLSWDMWWGENAVGWELFENGESVYSASLTASTPNAQSASCELTGRESGSYEYYVRLYNSEGGYSQSKGVNLSVASGN